MAGRVHKNETINNTMIRIAKDELNIELKLTSRFIGVFEHFYDDSIYKDVLTHYVIWLTRLKRMEREYSVDLKGGLVDTYEWYLESFK